MMENAVLTERATLDADLSTAPSEIGFQTMMSRPGSQRGDRPGSDRRLAPDIPRHVDVVKTRRLASPVSYRLPFARLIQGKSAGSMPVPGWDQLPELAKTELERPKYNRRWYEDPSRTDQQRLTVLNLYVKMRGMGLWVYVTIQDHTSKGSLNFRSARLEDLKTKLRERDDFTTPEESPAKWSSREKRARGSLHIKHWGAFTEAHIDQFGLFFRSAAWWAMPLIPLALMGLHLGEYLLTKLGFENTGYQNPFSIRDILLSQGWWKEPLLGKGVVSPYSGKPSANSAIEPPEEIRLEMGRLQHQGQPMEDEMRRPYESYFDHDFSQVRLHSDEHFGNLARSMGLEAFTVGQAIVFEPGKYAPHTPRGRALLAHELAHVRQQNPEGSVDDPTRSIARAYSVQAEKEAIEAERSFPTNHGSGLSATDDDQAISPAQDPGGPVREG